MACMSFDLPSDYEAFVADVISDQGRDSQGVYEVLWHANSRYPDLRLSSRVAIAESVVQELLRRGRVTLVRGKWIGPDHPREAVVDVAATLRDNATWMPVPGEPVVWMADR